MTCAETNEPVEMSFGCDSGGSKETCIRWGPGYPKGRGNFFFFGWGAPCNAVIRQNSLTTCFQINEKTDHR